MLLLLHSLLMRVDEVREGGTTRSEESEEKFGGGAEGRCAPRGRKLKRREKMMRKK